MGLLDKITQQDYYDRGDFGNYQFTSLDDIINQFMVAYVGEDKIISKIKRVDVAFHAQRALAELSFDTFKSCKAQEITVPASLQMILPQDYVNYTKVSWVDSAGIKHLLYPTSKTSNPMHPQIDDAGDFMFDGYSVTTVIPALFNTPESAKTAQFPGKLIPSGDLIKNGRFHGGSHSWSLNVDNITGVSKTTKKAGAISTNPVTSSIEWLWDNNNLIGYNIPQDMAFRQYNVPIYSGEEYTITYTVSGYSTGTVNFMITDENGDYTFGTDRTANGTYTETVTAGTNDQDGTYTVQTLSFLSNSATRLNATIDTISMVRVGSENSSTASGNYKSATPSENQDDYQDDTYWKMSGNRYGLDPQHSQANGSFYIDCKSGKIHFSSNISGKTVILDYISDSLGTDKEMQVHKFAEEAMYKWIAYAILSTRANTQEYIVRRFKKERFAAIRSAKLRLSNIKLEEITQVLRGKSKQIKH